MKNRLALLAIAALLAAGLTAPAFGASNVISSSAVSAKTTAEKALALAKKANKRAKAAQASAAAAQADADSALTAAAAAQSSANTAQAAADAAQATANSKFGNLSSESGDVSANDQNNKVAIADCPGSTEATGGGYVLGGGDNAAYVQINFPYGTEAWYVDVKDNGDVNSAWTAQAWVNCIS
jgi:hypothetical protein